MRIRFTSRKNYFGSSEFSLGSSTDENRLDAVLVGKNIDYIRPSLGDPVFCLLARCNYDGSQRPRELRNELSLPFALRIVGTNSPFDRLWIDLKMPQEFEVLILDVLNRMRRDPFVRKKPVRVSCPGAIEPNPARRSGE